VWFCDLRRKACISTGKQRPILFYFCAASFWGFKWLFQNIGGIVPPESPSRPERQPPGPERPKNPRNPLPVCNHFGCHILRQERVSGKPSTIPKPRESALKNWKVDRRWVEPKSKPAKSNPLCLPNFQPYHYNWAKNAKAGGLPLGARARRGQGQPLPPPAARVGRGQRQGAAARAGRGQG